MKLRKVEPRAKPAAGIGGRPRVLVTVTVLGSAGPLRFLVDEGESVTGLVRAALRCYAREGRMPLLGADAANFLLYTANGRSNALKADERISFNGCRTFMLWQKTVHHTVSDDTGLESALVNSLRAPAGRGAVAGNSGSTRSFSTSVSRCEPMMSFMFLASERIKRVELARITVELIQKSSVYQVCCFVILVGSVNVSVIVVVVLLRI